MQKYKYLFAAFLLLCSYSAFAASSNTGSFNVLLSDQSARFIFATEAFSGQYGPVDMEFGLFFNQDDDKMAHIGLMVRNDTLDSPLVISIGTRLYYADAGNGEGQTPADIGALAIGGELLFIPENFGGLGLGFHYFVAPSVVAFLDADNFTEYGIRLEYEITKQASAYLGYQKIQADVSSGETLELDSSVYIGIGMRF